MQENHQTAKWEMLFGDKAQWILPSMKTSKMQPHPRGKLKAAQAWHPAEGRMQGMMSWQQEPWILSWLLPFSKGSETCEGMEKKANRQKNKAA